MEKFLEGLKKVVYSIPGRGFFSSVMLISSFFAIFSALPPLLTYVKEGKDRGVYVLLFGLVFTFLLGGVAAGVIYLGLVAFSSIILAELIKSKRSFGEIILLASVIIIGTYGVIISIYSLYLSTNIMNFLVTNISSIIDFMSNTYPEVIQEMLRNSGMNEKELALSIAIKIPSTIVVGVVIFLFINLLIMARFEYKLGNFLKLKNLSKIRVPEYFLWPALIFGALYVYSASEYNSSDALKALSLLLFKGVMLVYFFHGLSITYLFIFSRVQTAFLSTLLFSLIVIFAYIFITIIGFFDTWFDFRKYLKTKKGD